MPAAIVPPAAGRRTLAVLVLIPALAALVLSVFAWPAARIAPRDLPIGVAGPAAAATAVERGLGRHEGAFEIHRYADAGAARAAIENRDVYGAVVVTPGGTELLTASAASPAVAGLLREAVTAQVPAGAPVRVTDVVAAPAGDPRGAALGASLLPLALVGAVTGAATVLLGLRGAGAVATLVGAAALTGPVGAALADSWLGALAGDWWAEAGVLGLTVLAIGATFAGLATLLGKPGLALGAVLTILLGNAFSGMSSAPELLPTGVGALGQWLPPGAGGSALRSVSAFEGAAAGRPLLVLSLWAVAGLAATALGARRRRTEAVPAPAQAPVPVG
ncbi:ABC transporter permease [Streptomyces sp. NK15101]|uniref:ABC transporter permease n=1 Tax=Streptomyces sp. NK15101 TaxID=2873261 RepID=UPI001CECB071|nr:ABC transporter permease [Streptomyces sp. NK15101]